MIDYSVLKFNKGTPREIVRLERRRASKTTERRIREKVNDRDQRRCFWIGCRDVAYHKHHKVYRSRGGKWETENIVSGCALHHRWVHKGLIRLIGNPDVAPLEIELTKLGREARIRVPARRTAA